MTLTIIDWIFAIIILIFAVTGIIKGFIDNIFGKLAVILGIILAYFFYKDVATGLLKDIKIPIAANVISFLLIFVVVFLIVKIIQMIIQRIFQFSILKSLDRTLGFLFGIVEGCAVVCLTIFLLDAQPFFDASKILEGSFFYNLVASFTATNKEIGQNV